MSNIHDYYRKNSLYEGHRMMLPELRDRVARTCPQCKFYILIAGKTGIRTGCAALIPQYANLVKRVPEKLDVTDILKIAGKDGLERVLAGPGHHRQACGLFHPKKK
ncbi:MAG: hypothetical protein PHY77_05275 [Desulfotomaculaceae bacterium]|nr:hypothetical protein [Desulfotomaculaceae bacterium]